jgi:hypothetical protein
MKRIASHVRTDEVCTRILKASARHEVDPLAVVGLLALHALVDTDFPLLRVWIVVVNQLREILISEKGPQFGGSPAL